MPKLTTAKAKSLTEPGLHGDSDGLYLKAQFANRMHL